MSKVVMVVSDEGLGGVVPFGRAIRASGRVPVLLTGRVPAARLAAWGEIYDDIQVLDNPYDARTLATQALQSAGGRSLAGVFSCYDGLVVPAARAAALLGLPHPAITGLERSRNKYATRLATRRHGLPTPRFGLVASEDGCAEVEAQVGFPAVIKPLNGMASHLVRRVDGPAALRSALRELAARVSQSFSGNYAHPVRSGAGGNGARSYDARSTFLVEQFLEGSEYSAEIIVRDGAFHRVALFHKFLVDQQGFLECGFTRPALGLSPEREEAIWCHIEDCLTVLGVGHAAAHVEVMDTPAGPFVVEVNAGRAGGQILVRAVRERVGVDLIAEILALQCGEPRPPTLTPTLQGRVTTLTVFPPASGRLERLGGLDAVAELPGVVDVIPFCRPGDVLDVEDKEFFAVNLLVSGGNGDALRSLYQEACRLVQFTIVPLTQGALEGVEPC